MTFSEAVERIKRAKPGHTFSVELEYWHHERSGHETVEWSFYESEENKHHQFPALAALVETVCGTVTLAEVDAAIQELPSCSTT